MRFNAETTFDDFLDQSLQIFWLMVEDNLARVRGYIDSALKPILAGLFVRLLKTIGEATDGFSTPDLDNAIRVSQTKAQNGLEGTKEWFRTAQPLASLSFAFEDLVHIGLEQVKKFWREFRPNIDIEAQGLPQFSQLTQFSDIFYLIFGNIARHSGLASPLVSVAVDRSGELLTIVVESEIAEGVMTEDAKTRVDTIREKLNRGEDMIAGRSVGGKGLMKLRSRLGVQTGEALSFGFQDQKTFRVKMLLSIPAASVNPVIGGPL